MPTITEVNKITIESLDLAAGISFLGLSFALAVLFVVSVTGFIAYKILSIFLTGENRDAVLTFLLYIALGIWGFIFVDYFYEYLKYTEENGFLTFSKLWNLIVGFTSSFSESKFISQLISILGVIIYIIAGLESSLALYERINRWTNSKK